VRDTGVGVSDDRFVVDATLQCPECGHEWDVSSERSGSVLAQADGPSDVNEHVAVCRECEWEQVFPKREMAEHGKRVHEDETGHAVVME